MEKTIQCVYVCVCQCVCVNEEVGVEMLDESGFLVKELLIVK